METITLCCFPPSERLARQVTNPLSETGKRIFAPGRVSWNHFAEEGSLVENGFPKNRRVISNRENPRKALDPQGDRPLYFCRHARFLSTAIGSFSCFPKQNQLQKNALPSTRQMGEHNRLCNPDRKMVYPKLKPSCGKAHRGQLFRLLRFCPTVPRASTFSMYSVASGTLQAVSPISHSMTPIASAVFLACFNSDLT